MRRSLLALAAATLLVSGIARAGEVVLYSSNTVDAINAATEEFNKQIPFKRHAKADEIAGAALYLASDLSSFVTGTMQVADGGLTIPLGGAPKPSETSRG